MRSGVVLILTVGILAILSLIAVSFATNMQLEQKAAVNYLNSVKAECLAEAGIQKALADIRKWAKEEPYSTLIGNIAVTYPDDNTTEAEIQGAGTYLVQIQDESAKVNINTLTDTDSAEIDKLLNDGGLTYDQIAKIIDYRDADGYVTTRLYTSGGWKNCQSSEEDSKNYNFATIEEIKVIGADISEAAYEKVKDYITVYKPIIRGGLIARYFKGLNGTSPNVQIDKEKFLDKIVELGPLQEGYLAGTDGDAGGWIESHDANFAGSYLFSRHPEWGDWKMDNFGLIYEGYIYIEPTETGMPIAFLLYGNDGMRLYIDNIIIPGTDRWYDDSATVVGSYTFEYAGWHPIRIEFYNVNGEQALELEWKTTVLDTKKHIPPERFGFDSPMKTDYNSAGIYKITSTGTVKNGVGSILAEKKISAYIDIFGTWTITERSEFSAPWNKDNTWDNKGFSDGEIKQVTWLDNCPTNGDTGSSWDGASYTKISDSLKLGYWDNFEEDVAYSVVNLRAYSSTGASWAASYEQILDANGGGDGNKFNIHCETKTDKIAVINENYYSSGPPGMPLFARAREQDWGQLEPGSSQWGYSSSQRKDPVQPVANWCSGYFSVKSDNTEPPYYNIYLSDGDDTYFGGDFFQIWHNSSWCPSDYGVSYKPDKVLGFISDERPYFQGYLDGVPKVGGDGASAPVTDIIYLTNKNKYDLPEGEYPLVTTRNGALSESEAHFDNIRVIPSSGYFVSTPFCASLNDITWGTISWNEQVPVNTAIALSIRTIEDTENSFPIEDTGFASVTNGGQITNTGNWLQFKAGLSSAAFNTADYSGSSVTPVLEDVTVTYLPRIEVLYWRNEVE